MKACLLHHPGDILHKPLVITEDIELPVPGQGEVLIKVNACGVCRTDLHVIEGELGPRKLPLIPGHQIVGTVHSETNSDSKTKTFTTGDRVGVAWLHRTCRCCHYCDSGRENLCCQAEYTGWTCNGGFAEYVTAPADFVYKLPDDFDDLAVAPLLCAGIIGYRCLQQTEIQSWAGAKLGIYGFGAAGHIAIQIAKARGAEVFVFTRDQGKHKNLAEELGAVWVGDSFGKPPGNTRLDAAIVFAPAGNLVPAALNVLDRGGRLILGGIHMNDIPSIVYQDLYWEKSIKTVANNTREDGKQFLIEAAQAKVKTHIETFPLEKANEALIALKHKAIRGAAVLAIG